MSLKSTLRKEGIEVIKKLDTCEVNSISRKIANTLCNAFPEHEMQYDNLINCISSLKMYVAIFEDNSIGAKYFCKNNSIFLNAKISIGENDMFCLHECIHFLQDTYFSKTNQTSLGLYNIRKGSGISLNEAAVQLMTCEALGKQAEEVKYYNINLSTTSPTYYPLQCVLLQQVSYFTGTYPIYHSALHSNDVFKNTLIALSDEQTYKKLQLNMDKILSLEMELEFYTNELATSECKIRKINKLTSIIDDYKKEISKTFFATQNLIISHCFSKEFHDIKDMEGLKDFKNRLYEFKNLIAYNNDYTFYNDFYCHAMENIEEKQKQIENTSISILEQEISKQLTVVNTTKGAFAFLKRIVYELSLAKRKEMM